MLVVTLQKQQEQIDMFMNQVAAEVNAMQGQIHEQVEAQRLAVDAMEDQVMSADNEEMIEQLAQAIQDKKEGDQLSKEIALVGQ